MSTSICFNRRLHAFNKLLWIIPILIQLLWVLPLDAVLVEVVLDVDAAGGVVVADHVVREQGSGGSGSGLGGGVGEGGMPEELHLLSVYAVLLLFIIHPSKEQRFIAHIQEHLCAAHAMPKCISMPCYLRIYSKFLHQEFMTHYYVLEEILERRASFIRSNPPTIHKFPSPLLHQLSKLFFRDFRLLLPPLGEKHNLSMGELLRGVFHEHIEHICVDTTHIRVEVLVYGAQPACILMGVWYYVHCDVCISWD